MTGIQLRWRQPKRRGSIEGEAKQAGKLAFVNIDRPGQIHDQRRQSKIKRHVMSDIGWARRREIAGRLVLTAPPTFSAAYFDSMRICNYCRQVFFSLMLLDNGALRLAMDNAAADFSSGLKRTDVYPARAMQRYTQSLSIISARMGVAWNAVDRARAIATVVCLAFYDMRVRNAARWEMHMEGVRVLIEDGGGLACLEALQGLRQALSIADVVGSLVFDVPPRFELLMSTPRTEIPTLTAAGALDGDAIESILMSLSHLASQISKPVANPAQGSTDLSNSLLALAHRILALPRTDLSKTAEGKSTVRESIRVAALAFVSYVLVASSQDTLYSPRRQLRPLLVRTKDADWAGREELKLWILVMGAMAESSDRAWLVELALKQMRESGVSSWQQLCRVLQKFAWSEALADNTYVIKAEITRGLSH